MEYYVGLDVSLKQTLICVVGWDSPGERAPQGQGSVARKLAIILHRMWIDGTEFNWSKKEIAAWQVEH